LFKAATDTDQSAFLRIDDQPCGWTGSVRDSCFVHAHAPRTLSSDARMLSSSRKSRVATLPCAPLARLAAHLDCAGKMLLTDLCNRHSIRAPKNRSTPEPAACATATTSAMRPEREPQAIRIAASDHLAAIRPRVEQRLTALSSFGRATCVPPFIYRGGNEPRSKAALPCRGVLGRSQGRRSGL